MKNSENTNISGDSVDHRGQDLGTHSMAAGTTQWRRKGKKGGRSSDVTHLSELGISPVATGVHSTHGSRDNSPWQQAVIDSPHGSENKHRIYHSSITAT